ncbi:heparinase II/III family protein [Cohnella mopanensis]|uniref:heparinase II/III family protein n=1 Tax=Cohnella mopanensis TaxID=2911966 RepID=UPI001EF962DD|nr:heparinase II/III family protein [Cohnella mopanensis]
MIDDRLLPAYAERIVSVTDSDSLWDRIYYPPGERASAFWRRITQAPAYGRMIDEIRSEGERLIDEPIPELTEELFSIFERTGNRLAYEGLYFARRRTLNTFALLTLLEPGEGIYLDKLIEIMRAILDERTWCLPAHVKGADPSKTIDLFSAETGFSLGEIACVLGDRLPSWLALDIDGAISVRLIQPLLEHGPHLWEKAKHNWAAVCAGSIGSAALLRIKDADVLVKVLSKALASLEYYFEGFGDDGACLEGLGYWNYGFGYFAYFADLLKKLSHGTLDLFSHPKVRNIALFQQAAYLHGDSVACFSDSLPRVPFRVGLTHYLAGIYPELEVPSRHYSASFTDDHCSRWAPAFRDIVWFDPGLEGQEWGEASRYLPDAQWLVSRHVSSSGRRFGFAAKGGNNDEPHNHNDIGQFLLLADGITVAGDLGSGEYTADYFGEGRYAYDCNGSQGHSVPIIGGNGQSAGADCRAIVLEASAGVEEDILRMELSSAYHVPELKSLVREIRWRKSDSTALIITDDIVFAAEPEEIVERIVALNAASVEEGGVVRIGGKAGEGAAVFIRYDESLLEATVERRAFRNHFGQEKSWYAIDFCLRCPELTNRVQLLFEWEAELE